MKRFSLIEYCVHLVTPLAMIVAFFFFLRGHNAPGGGFIAGLVVAIAFVIYAIGYDLDSARNLLPTTLERLFAFGLFVAGITGVGSIVLGLPFLTSGHTYISLGLLDKVHIVSTILFDLGVFCVVISVVAGLVFQFAQRRCELYWPVPSDESSTWSEAPTSPFLVPFFRVIMGLEDRPTSGEGEEDEDGDGSGEPKKKSPNADELLVASHSHSNPEQESDFTDAFEDGEEEFDPFSGERSWTPGAKKKPQKNDDSTEGDHQ